MKRILMSIALLLGLFVFDASAKRDKGSKPDLPSHSISIFGGYNLNGGYEVNLEAENYFNSNHTFSLYGLFGFHTASENWAGMPLVCRKAMGEIGGKYYIPAVRGRFYPYLGAGVTAGLQNIKQSLPDNEIILDDKDKYLVGCVGTVGLEFLFCKNVSMDVRCRFKYDGMMHYVLGAGLKFMF